MKQDSLRSLLKCRSLSSKDSDVAILRIYIFKHSRGYGCGWSRLRTTALAPVRMLGKMQQHNDSLFFQLLFQIHQGAFIFRGESGIKVLYTIYILALQTNASVLESKNC